MNDTQRDTSRRSAGFTIVELLIVIVVIGVLAAITVSAFNGVSLRAKFTTSKQDMASIRTALELYHAENDAYPDSADCANAPGE